MTGEISNEFNRDQYSVHAQDYLESNSDGKIGGGNPQVRAQFLVSELPVGSHVFEIGSGGGEDALALQAVGLRVTASDFVPEFVSSLKQKKLEALLFDAKKDDIPEGIDAIYANAVFVHFTPEEIKAFLIRARAKLQGDKVVFISVIKGEGSERSARGRGFERDFHYYTLDSLKELVEETGFSVTKLNDSDNKWLQIVCKAR